jgi:hypothetical protein
VIVKAQRSGSLRRRRLSFVAKGNCVIARWGGEQPKAKHRSATEVNSIRPVNAASLLLNGEASNQKSVGGWLEVERWDGLALKQGDLPQNSHSRSGDATSVVAVGPIPSYRANVSDGTRRSERAVRPAQAGRGRSQSVRSSVEAG